MHEVSRRVLSFYVGELERAHLDIERLSADLPSVRAAHAGERWYHWDEHVTFIDRFAAAVGGPERAEALARASYDRPMAAPYRAMAQLLANLPAVYRLGFGWFGKGLYRNTQFHCTERAQDRLEVVISIRPTDRRSDMFFRMWRAGLSATPCMLGLRPARVDGTWTGHEARFQITLPAGRDLFSRIRRRWLGVFMPESITQEVQRHQDEEYAAWEALLQARENERKLATELSATQEFVSLGRAVASIVHELSNPLTYVTSTAELADLELRKGRVDEAKKALESVQGGIGHLREVLRMVRATYGPTTAEASRVEVTKAVDTAVRFAAKQLEANARVVREYGPVPEVRANPARVTQIFLNLLLNAAQAFPLPAPANQVLVRTFATEKQVVVEVSDNGPGLPDAMAERVTTKPSGTGLGLSICRRLAAEMGATLELASTGGAGTTARLSFPRVEAEAEAQRSAPGREVRPAPDPAPKNVLIVDDQPNFVATTRLLLDGCTVDSAANVDDALEKVRDGDFDIILLDIGLPQKSGLSLYDALSREAPGSEKKVVFVTGGLVDHAAREFVDRAGARCLFKPFTREQLLDAIAGS